MSDDILTKVRDFLNRSSSYYKLSQTRMDLDFSVYSNDFWTEDTIKAWGRSKRPHESWDLWGVFVNAIVSPFSASPYHVELTRKDDEKAVKIQEFINHFEADQDVKFKLQDWLMNSTIVGQSVAVLSLEDPTEDSFATPVLEVVDDIKQVALDPSINTSTGEDAEEGAVINYISLNKAKRLYGNDVVPMGYPDVLPPCCDIGDQWGYKEGQIQLINYYYKGEDGFVRFVKVCGTKMVLKEEVKLPFRTIPIIRMTGYKFRNTERKIDYMGIVRKTLSLQAGANVGYSTLLERLNRSPKANFLMPVGAIENLEKYYQILGTDESAVVLYNGTVAPTPIVENFQTEDLVNTIRQSAELMSQSIGIPISGINGINFNDKTATEVLVQQNNAISNVACFYAGANKAVRVLGSLLLENAGLYDTDFKLENGPEVITRGAKERQILSAIAQYVPENMKGILAVYMARSVTDEYAQNLAKELTANLDPTLKLIATSNEDPNAVHILNGMKMTLDQTMQELEASKTAQVELQKQLETAQLQLMNAKNDQVIQLKKAELDARLKMMEIQMKAQEGDADRQADLAKQAEDLEIEYKKLGLEAIKVQDGAERATAEALTRTGGIAQ